MEEDYVLFNVVFQSLAPCLAHRGAPRCLLWNSRIYRYFLEMFMFIVLCWPHCIEALNASHNSGQLYGVFSSRYSGGMKGLIGDQVPCPTHSMELGVPDQVWTLGEQNLF